MRASLASAELPATAIDYVSAHATSTPGGDGEESAAMYANEDGFLRKMLYRSLFTHKINRTYLPPQWLYLTV